MDVNRNPCDIVLVTECTEPGDVGLTWYRGECHVMWARKKIRTHKFHVQEGSNIMWSLSMQEGSRIQLGQSQRANLMGCLDLVRWNALRKELAEGGDSGMGQCSEPARGFHISAISVW